MGTFHQDRGPLHGITVVVDAGRTVYIGRCDEETPEGIHLVDADVHEDGAGGQSKEDYVRRAARFGAWARHPRLTVPRDRIASVTRLGDVAPRDDGDLAERRCVPCRGGVPPLEAAARDLLIERLGGGWAVVDGHHLEKEFRFRDFREALAFTVRVGELAEAEGHHPDIHLAWGKVRLTVWTHKVNGLTESDFVLAAKVDRLPIQ